MDADEVYLLLYQGKHKTYRFIKYFKDRVIAVNVEIKTMTIRTAYEITNYNSEREGILLGVKK